MGEWTIANLEDCLDALLDYRGKSPKKAPTGIPVLSAKVVKTDGLLRPIEQTIAPDYYSEWMVRGLPAVGDVVMTTEAPLGEVIQLDDESVSYALGQRIVCMRGKEGVLDSTFLRYALVSPQQQANLAASATGTTVLGISQKALRRIEISFPDLPAQQRIGGLLSKIDDKIELNRRMIETLEEMARALFGDWFTDFGPTRRQMEGATDPAAIMGYAFPFEVATTLVPLFPAKLGEDGLPEGWAYSDVGTEFDVVMGQSPPGDTYNETGEGLPFFQGRRDFGFRFPSRRVYCTDPKRISGRDWTLLSVRAPVGDINRASEKCAIGRGVGAFLHKGGLHSFTYYTGLALRAELQSYDKDGTVFGSINQKQFKGLQVVVPDQSLVARFDEIANPMDEKIRLNTEENQTLADIRDLLLPKLMSGEIRLKDGEEVA